MNTDTNPLIQAFSAAMAAEAETPQEPTTPAVPTEATPAAPPETAPATPTDGPLEGTPLDMFKQAAEASAAPPEDKPANPADKFPESIDEKPEAKAKWGELRNELREAHQKLSEYEAKLNSAPKDDVYKALETRVAEYEGKLSEYEQELAVARVEATPEYKQLVTHPLNSIIETAESIAAVHKIEPNALIDALSEPDPVKQEKQLADLLEGVPERDRMRVYRMADDAAVIAAKSEELRARADAALSEVEARQRAEAEKQSQQRLLQQRQAAQKVWGLVKAKTPDLGVDLGSLEKNVVETNLLDAEPDAIAYAASASVILPYAVKALAQRDARIRELEKAVGALKSATPGSQPGGTGEQQPTLNPVAKFLFASA